MPPLGGRYALREPLGEGTFAVTYLAEDRVLGRLVAVKVLRARYGRDPAAAARFEREARAAAAVSSPYIVDVFDYGTDRGSPYIVLQYIAGPTLREHLDQLGRLEPPEAVRLAIEVLRGLEMIHRAGIVHRDVKPQNVLLDRNGTARVTDFGVALWSGAESLTSHGMAVGTAVYMAPEQARATEVGEGADLYAVGVMLFEMLTGRQPFHADNPTALMLAHVQRQPPLPTEALPGLVLPIALEREVMRALAKQPGDRRQSAREMADALSAAANEIGAQGGPWAAGRHPATTDSMPAFVAEAPATRADARAVMVRGPQSFIPRRGRAWAGPLALVLAALVLLGMIAMRGGFGGLAGTILPGGPDERPVVELSDQSTTPTPTPTVTATATAQSLPAATVLSEATIGSLFPGGLATATSTPPPAAAPTVAPAPTAVPTAAAASTVAPEPVPTEPPLAVEGDEAAEDREQRRRERRNRDQEQVQESIAPDAPAANPDESTTQFGAGDWQGAAPAEAGSFGRPAVALYGADGGSARAALQFDLPSAPTGAMRLTLSGLGDETGLVFPFGIEVNGMSIGSGTATFDNWQPGRDGLNGENAAWDQVGFTLAPEFFRAGLNEITIVSFSPGDYDDRPPYLLLSDATLAPAE